MTDPANFVATCHLFYDDQAVPDGTDPDALAEVLNRLQAGWRDDEAQRQITYLLDHRILVAVPATVLEGGDALMPWVKVDDQFMDHPKVVALGDNRLAGMGLFILGLCYCARHLTDGRIPEGALPAGSDDLAAALVDSGLWEQRQDAFQVHDYDHYQPLRADVLAQRERERVRKASQRSPSGTPGGIRQESGRRPDTPYPTRPVPVGDIPIPVSGRNPGGTGNGSPAPVPEPPKSIHGKPIPPGKHLVRDATGRMVEAKPEARPQVDKSVDNPDPATQDLPM